MTSLVGAGVIWLISSVYTGQNSIRELKDHQDALQKQLEDVKKGIDTHGGQLTRIETSATKAANDSALVFQRVEDAIDQTNKVAKPLPVGKPAENKKP